MDDLLRKLDSLRHKLAPSFSPAQIEYAYRALARARQRRRARNSVLIASAAACVAALCCVWVLRPLREMPLAIPMAPPAVVQPMAASLAPASLELANDLEALLDAADAARAGDQPETAAMYLRRVLEHRASPSTPLAAFTLGRLLLERLGRPAEAAEAFATAAELAPDGSLAQDALAREVEAWSKAGRMREANLRAQQFARRYPDSRRLRVVQVYGGLLRP